jgi:hypothetical protein
MLSAAAGVAVVVSVGNTGPAAGTVENPFPYATIVAASTHSRETFAYVKAGGKQYKGAAFY